MRELARCSFVGILVLAGLAAGCADPNKYDPNTDPARTDARSQSDGPAGGSSGAGGGADAGSTTGGTSGSGGSPVLDAPSESSTPACTAGATRCASSGAAVEVCTVEGEWVAKETCPSTCASGACSGMCRPTEKHCGANQTPETCSAAGAVGRGSDALPERLHGAGRLHRGLQARHEALLRSRQPHPRDLQRERRLGGGHRLSEPLLQRLVRRFLPTRHQALRRKPGCRDLQPHGHMGTRSPAMPQRLHRQRRMRRRVSARQPAVRGPQSAGMRQHRRLEERRERLPEHLSRRRLHGHVQPRHPPLQPQRRRRPDLRHGRFRLDRHRDLQRQLRLRERRLLHHPVSLELHPLRKQLHLRRHLLPRRRLLRPHRLRDMPEVRLRQLRESGRQRGPEERMRERDLPHGELQWERRVWGHPQRPERPGCDGDCQQCSGGSCAERRRWPDLRNGQEMPGCPMHHLRRKQSTCAARAATPCGQQSRLPADSICVPACGRRGSPAARIDCQSNSGCESDKA